MDSIQTKLKRLNKNKAKHSGSHESTGVDNTDRQI